VQVGIDIEKVAPLDNYQLKNYFNEEELSYIDDDKLRFYEVWTKKEAILKAAGNVGLMQAKEIKFYGPYAVFMQLKWHLYTFDRDDYQISVASSREQEIEWIKDTLI
jgi:4'-phosphopantetheinyl transferase